MATKILSSSLAELDSLQKNLKRGRSCQVGAAEERALIKATCLSWFNNHRPKLLLILSESDLTEIDEYYKNFLTKSEHHGVREKYLQDLKQLKKRLVELRSLKVTTVSTTGTGTDVPPDFSPLIADKNMQLILERRWAECAICVHAPAPLAATVMMGGLLEALLLARIHRETDKTRIMNSQASPKDKSNGKTLPLQGWMLRDFIDVLHDVGLVSKSVKDIGVVLRDYRNYIHPYKELSHGIKLESSDAALWWEITKGIAKDLLARIK